MRSVGVTGTNGKSTTTTWVAAALSELHPPVFVATTLGHCVGSERIEDRKPRWDGFLGSAKAAAARGATLAAIELTSRALWGGAARAWPCEVGVFTNFSRDHFDTHGDPEHYLACKAQLFLSIPRGGTAVLNACDAVFPLLAEVVPPEVRVATFGSAQRGAALAALDAEVLDPRVSWDGTTFELLLRDGSREMMSSPAIGEVFAENAAAAYLAAVAMGVPRGLASAAIARTPAPRGRFEVVSERPHVVVDYAHTPDAIARTCKTGWQLAQQDGGTVAMVFGAGGGRDRAKRPDMGRAARAADRIILTSDNPRDEDPEAIATMVADGLAEHPHVETELDRRRAITRAVVEARERDVVIVCGKGHETEQLSGAHPLHFSDHDVIVDAVRDRSPCT